MFPGPGNQPLPGAKKRHHVGAKKQPDGHSRNIPPRIPFLMLSPGDLFYYPHTSLNGTVSAKVSVQLESCRNLCSARSGCAGFDYSLNGDVCRLFASVGGAEESQRQTAGARSLVAGYLRRSINLLLHSRPNQRRSSRR